MSTAKGRFQFLDSSWQYYGTELWGEDLVNKSVFNYQDNTDLAIFVYHMNGTIDWLASESCWNQ